MPPEIKDLERRIHLAAARNGISEPQLAALVRARRARHQLQFSIRKLTRAFEDFGISAAAQTEALRRNLGELSHGSR